MCGICGLLHLHGSPIALREPLEQMNAALVHRGPDDAGMWEGDGAALAMRRLNVIDPAGSRQPMWNEDGTVVAVFNGEIYNFQELRRSLMDAGHVFRSAGDTEVLVHGYEEYGDGLLARLNGMFAFAIYDVKAKRLLMARDPIGIKPLYYANCGGHLVFASELGALMASNLAPASLSPAALGAYFEFLAVPAPDTIYAGVYKLRPGEALIVDDGVARTERYWEPRFDADAAWTEAGAAERFRELLRDAVRLQSVSDVPLGAFLSGGMDSASVVAAMAEHGGTVKTFSVGFDDCEADELAYARAVAGRFETDHTEVVLTPDWVDMIPRVIAHFGEPFADSSALPTWLVSEAARAHVTVVLSGDGGDELFAGYTWLHRTLVTARWGALPRWIRRTAAVAGTVVPSTPRGHQVRRALADLERTPREIFRRRESCFERSQLHALLATDIVPEALARDRYAEHGDQGGALPDADWMLRQDLVTYLPDDVLTKVDRMSMAHSLEVRVPLLDQRMVAFACTVPFALKYRDGISKRVMKTAMKDLLPDSVLAQRKRGFAIPIQRWFRESLGEHFECTLLRDRPLCAEWLKLDTVRALFEEHRARRENHGHRLWAILALETWLRSAPRAPS